MPNFLAAVDVLSDDVAAGRLCFSLRACFGSFAEVLMAPATQR
jgi:hypothetical protein